MNISESNSPIATTSIESDPRSLVTVQVYVPATPTASLILRTLEYVEVDLPVTV